MNDKTIYTTESMGAPTTGGQLIDKGLKVGLSAINQILGGVYSLLSGGFQAVQDAVQRKRAREKSGEVSVFTDNSDINLYGGRIRGEGVDFGETKVIKSYEDVSNNAGIASSVTGVAGNALRLATTPDGWQNSLDEISTMANKTSSVFDEVFNSIFSKEDKDNELLNRGIVTPGINNEPSVVLDKSNIGVDLFPNNENNDIDSYIQSSNNRIYNPLRMAPQTGSTTFRTMPSIPTEDDRTFGSVGGTSIPTVNPSEGNQYLLGGMDNNYNKMLGSASINENMYNDINNRLKETATIINPYVRM